MKRLLCCSVILLWGSGLCFSEFNYTLNFGLGANSELGASSYDIKFSESGTNGRSKLEFPLATYISPSLYLELNVFSQNDPYFRLKTDISINNPFLDPYLKMEDHDWIQYSTLPELKFSYTESDSSLINLRIMIQAGVVIYELTKNDFLLFNFGYRMQHIYHEVNNITGGWQMHLGTLDIFYFDEVLEKEFLTYSFDSHSFLFGLGIYSTGNGAYKWTMDINPLISYMKDVDDHVQRKKISSASGIGWGLNASASYSLYFFEQRKNINPYIGFSGNLNLFYAPLLETQKYYSDDPTHDGDQKGLVINDIDHLIESFQYKIGLYFGLELDF